MITRKNDKGFTLIELMIVVVIIGILAALAIPRFMTSSTKAKQSEAKQMLKQVFTMQRAYKMEYDTYTLNGVTADSTTLLAFTPIRVELMLPARYSYAMTAAQTSFSCTATAQLDDDTAEDIWIIDESGVLRVLNDDVVEIN